MKIFFPLILFAGIGFCSQAQTTTYNKALADSLGADQYGMKMYVLVMLKSGPVTEADKAVRDSLFTGHMANINRLVTEGKLIIAGPMGKNDKNYRGLFIFNVPTVAEAEKLVNTDPAIQSKLLAAEFYPWYGSAALPAYIPVHKTIEQEHP